jgi:two-component system, response regulator PdtaR
MGMRILIVEDEIISAMALERMLAGLGCVVIGTVATGEDAIEWAKREAPDLIAMDIRLSGSMDGIEAAEKIEEALGTPIIFMTGYDDKETRERALSLKPLGFMVKPINRKKFEEYLA